MIKYVHWSSGKVAVILVGF